MTVAPVGCPRVLTRAVHHNFLTWPPPADIYLAEVSLLDTPDVGDTAHIVLMPDDGGSRLPAHSSRVVAAEHALNPVGFRAAPAPVEDGLIGARVSEPLRRAMVRHQLRPARRTTCPSGESGTGKQVDRAPDLIPARQPAGILPSSTSNRRAISHRSFSKRSCSASNAARSPRRCASPARLMELAHGGTLFLDEIGELNCRPSGEAPTRAGDADVRRLAT